MNITFPFSGEIFSLCSAIFWALAVIFLKQAGEKIHPIALNLFKNGLGVILFTITLLFLGESIIAPEEVVLTNED